MTNDQQKDVRWFLDATSEELLADRDRIGRALTIIRNEPHSQVSSATNKLTIIRLEYLLHLALGVKGP